MTGIGAYYYIIWAIWLRHCLNERQDEFVLKWPSVFSIPEVLPLADAEKSKSYRWANGYSNGYSNGNGISNGKPYVNGHGSREDRKSV